MLRPGWKRRRTTQSPFDLGIVKKSIMRRVVLEDSGDVDIFSKLHICTP